MNTPRVRNLALLLVITLLVAGTVACEIGGGPSKPTIVITAPTSDAEFEQGEEVTVLSSANDATGIARVELYVDGQLYRTDSSPSPEGEESLAMAQTWVAEDPGSHTLSVTAYNVEGEASEPWAVTIRVVEAGGAVTPPTPTSSSAPPPEATSTPAPPPEATATTPPPTETVPPPPPTDTAEPELPDLYISEIRLDPESPQQGSAATVGVRIHNGGTVEASGFNVVWRSAGPTIGCEWPADPIAPGGARWYQCEYTYGGWNPNYTTTAIVDADGDVDELDEDNNVLTLVVNVQPAAAAAPDLHVTDIRIEPTSPVMGSWATIGVKVHNQGNAVAHNFKVVWLSGEPIMSLEWTVTSLAPGAYSSWLQSPYRYTGHGHFTTRAIVDSDGDVDEIDEDNNERTKEIDVIP